MIPKWFCSIRTVVVAAVSIATLASAGQSTANPAVSNPADCNPGGPTWPQCRVNATSAAPPPTASGPTVYIDNGGLRGAQAAQPSARPASETSELQRLVLATDGQLIPVIGRDLFNSSNSSFSPAESVPADPKYVIGPGDELILRIWGHTNFNGHLTVDRSGNIYVPEVGPVAVAGNTFEDARKQIGQQLSRTYRNFEFSLNLGSLRAVQVFVLGQARNPGTYTLSGLSTILNALLTSGGPNDHGTLRDIEIRRGGQTVGTFDLYDIILRGKKQADFTLQSGDVLFIPYVGRQVALTGAVKNPGIYELRDTETLSNLLDLAGGVLAVGEKSSATIETVLGSKGRGSIQVSLQGEGGATSLHDQDVVHLNFVLDAFNNTVTIRGNLANPGRFPWHPGMRLKDIIPDKGSLLTKEYWAVRNRLGRPSTGFAPLPSEPATPNRYSAQPDAYSGLTVRGSRTAGQTGANLSDSSTGVSGSSVAEQQEFAADQTSASAAVHTSIEIPVAEIDWSYAVVERLNPSTLRNELLPFNLGRLVLDNDPSQNLELQPGDVVTILSQADIHVASDQVTKYVRVEGEVSSAGTYSVSPGETLQDVVRRAGGLTDKAYLYGSAFTRESARVTQQHRLDEYVASLTLQFARASAQRTTNAATTASDAADQAILGRLRQARATGRIVLSFSPQTSGTEAVPAIPLENGDTFRVASKPATVNVIGAVYGPNVFLYSSSKKARDYIALAGSPTKTADKSREFIIRADGSVVSSKSLRNGVWMDRFGGLEVYPGDTIVVPEKPITVSALRNFLDWSQIIYQFAIGALAINSTR